MGTETGARGAVWAGDIQELELGTAAAGHSEAGCSGQDFPELLLPSRSNSDLAVKVATPFPLFLTHPAQCLSCSCMPGQGCWETHSCQCRQGF